LLVVNLLQPFSAGINMNLSILRG